MKHPVKRVIKRIGKPVDVINSTSTGGREFPTENPEGTMRMVIEERGMAKTITDSSGTEHEVNIEFRAVPDDGAPDIYGVGDGEGATILNHPDAGRYRVIQTFVEDANVLVISAIED